MLEFIVKKIKEIGLQVEVQFQNGVLPPGKTVDALISITVGKIKIPYVVEIQKTATRKTMEEMRDLKENFKYTIFYADEIPRAIQQQCYTERIGFIDRTGTYYIPIELENRITDIPKQSSRKGKSRSFSLRSQTKSQIKVLLALMCGIHLETLRDLAEATGVSLGTASNAVNELKTAGVLEEKDRKREILDRAELIDSWVWNFNEKLLPDIPTDRFKTRDEKLFMKLRTGDFFHPKLFWSGAIGAAKLNADLITGEFLGYYEADSRPAIIRALKLEPDPKGEIELRRKFWQFTWDQQDLGISPLLLVYADLLASGDARDETAAAFIKREYLLK